MDTRRRLLFYPREMSNTFDNISAYSNKISASKCIILNHLEEEPINFFYIYGKKKHSFEAVRYRPSEGRGKGRDRERYKDIERREKGRDKGERRTDLLSSPRYTTPSPAAGWPTLPLLHFIPPMPPD